MADQERRQVGGLNDRRRQERVDYEMDAARGAREPKGTQIQELQLDENWTMIIGCRSGTTGHRGDPDPFYE